MDLTESVEIDRPGFLPALAEMKRETFAQAEPYLRLRFGQRPGRLSHRAHDEIERFVDCRPAVHQRVIPVEQDCSRARDCGATVDAERQGAHAAAASVR